VSIDLVTNHGSDQSGGETDGINPGGGKRGTRPPPFNQNPWPPKGPNGKVCLADVVDFLLSVRAEVRANPGGVGGVETWQFTCSDGHVWEVKVKRLGSFGVPGSEEPRVTFQDTSRQIDSFFNPETGRWSGRTHPNAHVPMDAGC
jgi:hypothetical protein